MGTRRREGDATRHASRAWAAVLVLGLVAPVLAGCVGGVDDPADPTAADAAPDGTPCEHPWPCADGSEWPANLTGPFELGEVRTDPIESFDGTPLETTIYIPDLPDGVRAPVVLWSQPYTGDCAANALLSGGCMPPSDSEYIYEGGYSRVDPSLLVEHGFAVAIVNVRGTGNSGGCFGFGGASEQQDQVHLVQWLADRNWSNGRVAMYGHSYHGWTPWMAAVQAPSALKTVVASGLVTDPYTFTYSPQGAPSTHTAWFNPAFAASLNFLPPLGGGVEHATAEHADRFPDRLCPDVARTVLETPKGAATDLRDGAFWDERRLVTGFPNVSAAVLVSHGLNDDAFDAGHSFQEDDAWHSLPAETPKHQIAGQWGHDLPPPEAYLEDAPFGSEWYEDVALPWLDFWLKGVGDPGDLHLGTVHYQDQTRAWHGSTSWPPAGADDEVLYLSPDGALAPEPSEGSRSFVAADATMTGCARQAQQATSLLYASEPLEDPVTLAGNPWAYLQVESTEPGGVVTVHLVEVGPDGGCSPVGEEGVQAVLSGGAADLRFHEGSYMGEDFPVLEPTPVRVDIYNDAWTFEAGDRVGVLVSSGVGINARTGQPWTPLLTLHGGTGPQASHVVLPLVQGTLGGDAPTLDYPPQPFLPHEEEG